MPIEELKGRILDFAKDVRLNLSSIMSDESLDEQTRYGLFVSCAVATRNAHVISTFEALAAEKLTPGARCAAKAAASLMAMTNTYYRMVHLASNTEYGAMPARLRMNVVGNPGVRKGDFELWSLAVSTTQRMRRLHRHAREGASGCGRRSNHNPDRGAVCRHHPIGGGSNRSRQRRNPNSGEVTHAGELRLELR